MSERTDARPEERKADLAVDLLQCPACRGGTLRVEPARLACVACATSFPVVSGIACFVRRFDDYTENYDRICADDLQEPKTPSVVKEILACLVEEQAAGVTCDLGCGDGYVIRRVRASRRLAVDIARRYLEGLPPEITRVWSRAEELPLRGGVLDTLICTDLIEHVLDVKPVRDQMVRVLRPGGRLLLGVPFEQDLSVYELPAYRAKYGRYKYVHLRSINDRFIAAAFPEFEVEHEHLITEGMPLMQFKPYPIKFLAMRRAA